MKSKIGNIQIFKKDYFFDFMKWRKLTVGISFVLVVLSLLVIGLKGLNYSIDFLGGSEVQVNVLDSSVTRDAIYKTLRSRMKPERFELTAFGTVINQETERSYLIRIQREKGQNENSTMDQVNHVISDLQASIGPTKIQIAKITSISGRIGKEDEYKGYMALLLACIGILVYVAFRFDARFAPGAVLCLVHNVIIALGFMTLLGKPFTSSSIAAFLTIVGYSINDTVIVYDRIRETRKLQPKMHMRDVVNRSISQTMNRTVLTSTTGALALLVLAIVGTGNIQDFAITMLVGIVVGTYSSIYVAAPLTLMMDKIFVKFNWYAKSTTPKSHSGTQNSVKNPAPPVHVRRKK